MINKILRLDFVLSKWFAGKRKTENVVPGLAYLFLSKVIYLGEVFKGVKTTCTKTINTKSAKSVHFDAVKPVFE